MDNEFSRTQMLLGAAALQKLASSRVAIFGIGGVGGYTAEALARSGIGALDLVDPDTVSITNINRQIYATHKTIGRMKADVAAERIADINPACKVTTHKVFFVSDSDGEFDFSVFDYVVDAIDTVTGKLALVKKAHEAGTPIISAMGAGNKLDPTAFQVADIYSTSVCPLAKVMRRELRKLGISSLKTVYSREPPITCESSPTSDRRVSDNTSFVPPSSNRRVPGSISFVPPVVGMIIAGEVIKDLIGIGNRT